MNFFYVVNEKIEDKNCAYAVKVDNSSNLISIFHNAKTVNACNTFKEAKEIADFWNQCYKNNGTYAF